jgi:hypothetical protein
LIKLAGNATGIEVSSAVSRRGRLEFCIPKEFSIMQTLCRHGVITVFVWLAGITLAAADTTAPQSDSGTGLPEPLASFGAVTCDGWIYVYSGHIGTAHDHSKDNLAQAFHRRRVEGGAWESLPMETPLQGLALVTHQGLVYRVGGMTAHNTLDQDPALFSTDAFACFDPATKQWTPLAPLPTGRSSHDAVVIDSKLYVVGGWKLSGDDSGEWQSDMLIYDFAQPELGWQSVEQPFERRALAASHHDGKLVVIGGMNADDKIDRSVNLYDPATSTWTSGPALPGEGMNGFGVSAWNSGQALLVSGSSGVVYRLADDAGSWQEIAKLRTARFFHQLVPAGEGTLLVLGGASRQGHLSEIESITPAQ